MWHKIAVLLKCCFNIELNFSLLKLRIPTNFEWAKTWIQRSNTIPAWQKISIVVTTQYRLIIYFKSLLQFFFFVANSFGKQSLQFSASISKTCIVLGWQKILLLVVMDSNSFSGQLLICLIPARHPLGKCS